MGPRGRGAGLVRRIVRLSQGFGTLCLARAISSAVRALASHARGHRFDPRIAHQQTCRPSRFALTAHRPTDYHTGLPPEAAEATIRSRRDHRRRAREPCDVRRTGAPIGQHVAVSPNAVPDSGPRAWIGTSGWSYDHWDGVLYPPGTRQLDRLGIYVREFPTVELNASFYRWPRDATFASWRRRLPPGFRMSVKAPRGLTHGRRLHRPEPWVERIDRAWTAAGRSHCRAARAAPAGPAAGRRPARLVPRADGGPAPRSPSPWSSGTTAGRTSRSSASWSGTAPRTW